MANTSTYSGALVRSAAYAFRPPVPGVADSHQHPTETGDIFQPEPGTPAAQSGDVWGYRDETGQGNIGYEPFSHWGTANTPVPLNVHSFEANRAFQDRMMAAHAVDDYRPNPSRFYKNADQGMSIEYVQGRGPIDAGLDAGSAQFLAMGKNAFDATNGATEVYGAEASGGSRYRLGTDIREFGLYRFWTKQGQDALLRAYEPLTPAFPIDKPPLQDTSPYTPNSRGTATWVMPQAQDVSMFALPSETAITDFSVQATAGDFTGSGFDDGGRM